ncbi:protein of unknown function DUF1555 [Thermodesulfatator indicus DSM 15286]|uniref:Ice-binding protein C-terminal domain-containing protein n=1 Tax=Thermodesulfatator indicus (strain DSM 15286 / JCM 11887 / CIR29812) TaxID=667014 RepID=F8AAA3_THEID|nr:PEP-CTERM sorting domain-containing protein [Thermodesulfatator indicus]AEH44239.1 protein of unknown function DUF1555 [Thermodesulfatator indicus DSM 15286]
MFKKVLSSLFLAVLMLGLAVSNAKAAPIVMEGNYVYTQVSEDGTLGNGFNFPGIQYDPSGTASFPGSGGKDFLQPGDPFEGFYLKSNESGIIGNNNDWSVFIGTLTDLSGSGYDNFIRWEGSLGTYFDVAIETYFNDSDKFIKFSTTVTALNDLTDVYFLRVIDPDQDTNDFGIFDTNNARGFGSFSPEDWVYAAGPISNWTIGLYSDSLVPHNTGVSFAWSGDPEFYYNGNNDGNGDYTIGLAFYLGDLSVGDSVTFDYYYVLGTSPADAASNIPVASPIPEPSTVVLIGVGLGALGFYRSRRK